MNNWISVEDRLPEDEVLVFIGKTHKQGIGSWLDCGHYIRFTLNGVSKDIDLWSNKPTHWQPLLEPPTLGGK